MLILLTQNNPLELMPDYLLITFTYKTCYKNVFQFYYQVTVSGDGLIHEVLNGLFERVDWREALARLPIGVIPGGSGNALSRTLVHEQVKGHSQMTSYIDGSRAISRISLSFRDPK